jgi:Flp pilus assembly protein TadG
VAAVELGILIVPLVLLAFGITEFGRAIYQYNTIAKGVRDGVRYLTQYAPGDATRIASATNLAVCGTTATCSDKTRLVAGLEPGMVSVCDRTNCAGTHNLQGITYGGGTFGQTNLVTMTVSGFEFVSLVPFVMPSITFGPIHATMEQRGALP